MSFTLQKKTAFRTVIPTLVSRISEALREENFNSDPLIQESVASLVKVAPFLLDEVISKINETLSLFFKKEDFCFDHFSEYDWHICLARLLRICCDCLKPTKNKVTLRDDLAKALLRNLKLALKIRDQSSIAGESIDSNNSGGGVAGGVARNEYFLDEIMVVHEIDKYLQLAIQHLSIIAPISLTQNILFGLEYLKHIQDDSADLKDIRVLEYCQFNLVSLRQILDVITASAKFLKKQTLYYIGEILHKIIWGWLQANPQEFVALYSENNKENNTGNSLIGICATASALFSTLYDMSESSVKRKILFNRSLTAILLLNPVALEAVVKGESNKQVVKESKFLDGLRKSLKSKSLVDVAILSLADLCKAFVYFPVEDVSCPLKLLVPEIEIELKAKLFDIENPYTKPDGLIDKNLLADCLFSLYQLNPLDISKNILPQMISFASHPTYKLVIINTCIKILETDLRDRFIEEGRLFLSSEFRQLLQDLIHPKKGCLYRQKWEKMASKKNVELTHNDELIIRLIQLFLAEPRLALGNGSKLKKFDENFLMFDNVCKLLSLEGKRDIKRIAMRLLVRFHDNRWIQEWSRSEDEAVNFWLASSRIIRHISWLLGRSFNNQSHVENGFMEYILNCLVEMLELRNSYLCRNSSVALALNSSVVEHQRAAAVMDLEVVLLSLLSNSKTFLCIKTIRSFSLILEEIASIQEANDDFEPVLSNIEAYRQLLCSYDPAFISAGKVAIQRKVHRFLRTCTWNSSRSEVIEVIKKVWACLYEIWTEGFNKKLYKSQSKLSLISNSNIAASSSLSKDNPLKSPSSPVTTDHQHQSYFDFEQWKSITSFMCSLADIQTVPEMKSEVEMFYDNLTDLIINKGDLEADPTTREWVRETVVHDASSECYVSVLGKLLNNRMGSIFNVSNETPIVNESNLILLEQTVTLLRWVLDGLREQIPGLMNLDISSFMIRAATYLDTVNSVNSSFMRAKIRFCSLVEVMIRKRSLLIISQEIRLRNLLLSITHKWMSDYISDEANGANGSDSLSINSSMHSLTSHHTFGNEIPISKSVFNQLAQDLDMSIVKASIALLLNLPLQPVYGKSGGDDFPKIKTKLFKSYFNHFVKILNRCRDSPGSSSSTTIGTSTSTSSRESSNLLKDLVILAISNLLHANIDCGLKTSLLMGYDEDPAIRTEFLQVLTNVLRQGAGFDQLAEGNRFEERYVHLVDLILDSKMVLVNALFEVCPINDMDDVSAVLFHLFKSRGKLERLMKSAIEFEVKKAETPQTLFRRTSISSKLMTLFAKVFGSYYLEYCLAGPVSEALQQSSPPKLFEIDISRLPSFEHGCDAHSAENAKARSERDENLKNLTDLCETFMTSILGSLASFPREFRIICRHLYDAVGEKFGASVGSSTAMGSQDVRLNALGSFIFLRFISPAVASPDAFNLISGDSSTVIIKKESRRGLILVSKVIQNLANQVLFGMKEEFMTGLNDFLEAKMGPVQQFLRLCACSDFPDSEAKITDDDEDVDALDLIEDETDVEMDDSTLRDILYKLHFYMADNSERISKYFVSYAASSCPKELSDTALKLNDQLSLLLARLEPVPELPGRLDGSNAESSVNRGNSSKRRSFGRSAVTATSKSMELVHSSKQNDSLKKVLKTVNDSFFSKGDSEEYRRQLLEGFMRRNSSKDLSQLERMRLFYEGGKSKEKRPVYYFISNLVDQHQCNFEDLIYFILSKLKTFYQRGSQKQFDLIVDLTGFGPDNEIPLEWCSQFLQLLPSQLRDSLGQVFFFNATREALRFLKKTLKTLLKVRRLTSSTYKDIVFVNDLVQFNDFIVASELYLPESSVSLLKENYKVFSSSQILLVEAGGRGDRLYVQVKVGSDVLLVASGPASNSKKSTQGKDFLGKIVPFLDVYPLANIEGSLKSTTESPEGNSVLLSINDREKTIVHLVAPSCGREILSCIIGRQSQLAKSSSSNQGSYMKRNLRPKDVPGALLNMALLNLNMEDDGLRRAAYKLLSATSIAFGGGFDLGTPLISADHLLIPANNSLYVKNISEEISVREGRFTLDFLEECFIGFSCSSRLSMKHLCLDYMVPWLKQLGLTFDIGLDDEKKTKVSSLVQQMVNITVKEKSLAPLIQSKVWGTLAYFPDLYDIIFECFLANCKLLLAEGGREKDIKIISETWVTIASVSTDENVSIAAKIIARLRDLIADNGVEEGAGAGAGDGVADDHDATAQIEIYILCKFLLALSFKDRIRVHDHLPDILHIIMMTFGRSFQGCDLQGVVYTLAVNVIHSICTRASEGKTSNSSDGGSNGDAGSNGDGGSNDAGNIDETQLRALKLLLQEFNGEKIKRLFDFVDSNSKAKTNNSRDMKPSNILSSSSSLSSSMDSLIPCHRIETLTKLFFDLVLLGAPSTQVSERWIYRWMSLTSKCALNPAALEILTKRSGSKDSKLFFQDRAFVIMGILAKDEISIDLFGQILSVFRESVILWSNRLQSIRNSNNSSGGSNSAGGDWEQVQKDALMYQYLSSIMSCMTKFIPNLLTKCFRQVGPMFWLCLAMIQSCSASVSNNSGSSGSIINSRSKPLEKKDNTFFMNDSEPMQHYQQFKCYNEQLILGCLNLMASILRFLDRHGFFDTGKLTLEDVMMKLSSPFRKEIREGLETQGQVNFEVSFPFSVSMVLMSVMEGSFALRSACTSLLTQLLQIHAKIARYYMSVGEAKGERQFDFLGYLTPLIVVQANICNSSLGSSSSLSKSNSLSNSSSLCKSSHCSNSSLSKSTTDNNNKGVATLSVAVEENSDDTRIFDQCNSIVDQWFWLFQQDTEFYNKSDDDDTLHNKLHKDNQSTSDEISESLTKRKLSKSFVKNISSDSLTPLTEGMTTTPTFLHIIAKSPNVSNQTRSLFLACLYRMLVVFGSDSDRLFLLYKLLGISAHLMPQAFQTSVGEYVLMTVSSIIGSSKNSRLVASVLQIFEKTLIGAAENLESESDLESDLESVKGDNLIHHRRCSLDSMGFSLKKMFVVPMTRRIQDPDINSSKSIISLIDRIVLD